MKKIALILLMAFFAVSAFAQNDETTGVRIPTGYQGFVELGNTMLHFDKDIPISLQISTTHGCHFNEHIFAGLGVAYEWTKGYNLLPVYANIRYVVLSRTVASPVISLRLGSYFGGNENIGAYGDLAAGVRFASKRDFAVSILVAGTYYSKIASSYNDEWMDSQGNWHYENVESKISLSGIAVRVGLEW